MNNYNRDAAEVQADMVMEVIANLDSTQPHARAMLQHLHAMHLLRDLEFHSSVIWEYLNHDTELKLVYEVESMV